MQTETVTYSREVLYRQIWRRPVREVARDYGVSDVALAKICKKLSIPRPPVGYWARRPAGRKDSIPPLPKLKPGERAEYIGEKRPRATTPTNQPSLVEPEHPPIRVSNTLSDPHELVRQSRGPLRRTARKRSVLISPLDNCLDIRISSGTLDRALRIADALLKALAEQGVEIEITPPRREIDHYYPANPKVIPSRTRVLIEEDWVEIGIDEDTDQPDPLPSRQTIGGYTYQPRASGPRKPNGKLALRIHSAPWSRRHRTTWRDGKVQRIETCLNSFVVGIEEIGHLLRDERLEQEQRERHREEEEKRRVAEEERRQCEAALIYDLDSRVNDWHRAGMIREFIAAVEIAKVKPGDQCVQWLFWARHRADTLEANAIETVTHLRQPPEARQWRPGY